MNMSNDVHHSVVLQALGLEDTWSWKEESQSKNDVQVIK